MNLNDSFTGIASVLVDALGLVGVMEVGLVMAHMPVSADAVDK